MKTLMTKIGELRDITNALHNFSRDPSKVTDEMIMECRAGKVTPLDAEFLENIAIGLSDISQHKFATERVRQEFVKKTLATTNEIFELFKRNTIDYSKPIDSNFETVVIMLDNLRNELNLLKNNVDFGYFDARLFSITMSQRKVEHFKHRVHRCFEKYLQTGMYNTSINCDTETMLSILRIVLDNIKNRTLIKPNQGEDSKTINPEWLKNTSERINKTLSSVDGYNKLLATKDFEVVRGPNPVNIDSLIVPEVGLRYMIPDRKNIGDYVLNIVRVYDKDINVDADLIESLSVLNTELPFCFDKLDNEIKDIYTIIGELSHKVKDTIFGALDNIDSSVQEYSKITITEQEYDGRVINNLNLILATLDTSVPVLNDCFKYIEQLVKEVTYINIVAIMLNTIYTYGIKPEEKIAKKA